VIYARIRSLATRASGSPFPPWTRGSFPPFSFCERRRCAGPVPLTRALHLISVVVEVSFPRRINRRPLPSTVPATHLGRNCFSVSTNGGSLPFPLPSTRKRMRPSGLSPFEGTPQVGKSRQRHAPTPLDSNNFLFERHRGTPVDTFSSFPFRRREDVVCVALVSPPRGRNGLSLFPPVREI